MGNSPAVLGNGQISKTGAKKLLDCAKHFPPGPAATRRPPSAPMLHGGVFSQRKRVAVLLKKYSPMVH